MAALAALSLLACASDGTVGPDQSEHSLAPVQLSANVAGTPINTLVITVTGDAIPTALTFNLTVANGVASGTLKVPAGNARLFAVQAFDTFGEVTHDGSVTTDVNRGQNPPIKISLVPRNGHQPVEIDMGDYMVVVTPGSRSILIGEQFQLSAQVTSPNGDHPTPVLWATKDPSIATVTPTGLVVGKRGGQTQIMATYGTVGTTVSIAVLDQTAALHVVGPLYPPPGGVTFTISGGEMGSAAGRLFNYSGFDLTQTRFLAFGADNTNMPAVKFNGTSLTGPIDDASRLAFDVGSSDPAHGVIGYRGTTVILTAGGSRAVFTRLLLTLTKVVGGVETTADLAGADQSGIQSIGGFAPITSAFTGGDAFHARIQLQASSDGNTWSPALDFFNTYPQRVPSTVALTSFAGAFYYSF